MTTLVELVRVHQKIGAMIARAEKIGDPLILKDIPELKELREQLLVAAKLILWNAPQGPPN
jgi:hypothetical protein